MKFISRLFHLHCSSASQLYSVPRKSNGLIISTPKKQPISTSFEFAGFKKQLEFVPSSLESAAHIPSCQWVISESTLQCEEPFSQPIPPTAIVWEGEKCQVSFSLDISTIWLIFSAYVRKHILKNAKILNWKQKDEILGSISLCFTYKITEGNCSFVLITSHLNIVGGGDS